MKFLRHLLGITKLDKEKNQCIRQKTGAQNTVKEIKQYQKSGYNMYRGWTQTDYQNKHYNINQNDEGTWDDRGRDGGTNFILRIKEQETRLTLQEHDDDDDDITYVNVYMCTSHVPHIATKTRFYNYLVVLVYLMTLSVIRLRSIERWYDNE